MTRKISRSFINGRTGVGTAGQGLKVEWDSTNDGELHWMDVDESSLEYVAPSHAQGSNYGFNAGGMRSSSETSAIDKLSFATDSDATSHGNLSGNRKRGAGVGSATHGYCMGGFISDDSNIIDKYSFVSGGTATDIGNLSNNRAPVGASSSDNGYAQTGSENDPNISHTRIDKLSYSSGGDSTNVASVTIARAHSAGQSSSTHGYCSGGYASLTDRIDKFNMSTDADSTDVGNLLGSYYALTGNSSTDYGYCSGNQNVSNVIQKFSFSSDGDSTDIANLVSAFSSAGTGPSSTTYGYTVGGNASPYTDQIQKFSFSSDADATDVGNLTAVTTEHRAGTQY